MKEEIKNWEVQSINTLVEEGISLDCLKSSYFKRNYKKGDVVVLPDLKTHIYYQHGTADHEAVLIKDYGFSGEWKTGLVVNKQTGEYWWIDNEDLCDNPHKIAEWFYNCMDKADGKLGDWDVKETDSQQPQTERTDFGTWYDEDGDGYRDR